MFFTTSGTKYLTHNSQFIRKPSYFRSFPSPMPALLPCTQQTALPFFHMFSQHLELNIWHTTRSLFISRVTSDHFFSQCVLQQGIALYFVIQELLSHSTIMYLHCFRPISNMAHQAIPEEEPPDPQPDFMKFFKTNFPSEPGRFPVLYYDQELLTKYVVEVQNPSIVPTTMLLCSKQTALPFSRQITTSGKLHLTAYMTFMVLNEPSCFRYNFSSCIPWAEQCNKQQYLNTRVI